MKLICAFVCLFMIGNASSLSVIKLRELVAEQNLFPKKVIDNKSNAGSDGEQHYALIVAGSNSWYNYRHQADVCHAYQILHKNGIPDENIVVMMYDDIAHNEQNPDQGIIINHPEGADVYHGVPKDYTGTDVTPENFLNILSGNSSAMQGIGSGKVINSGPNDHIFVYFSDHGAPGIVAFPTDELHATDLLETLQNMYGAQKYKKLVFYLEACESGSMFDDLADNLNIFATTAANDHESSYACYYDNHVGTYLGDVYSVKWLEDSDAEDLTSETLEAQFEIVRQETNTSHVLEFGDMNMKLDKVGSYQAQGAVKAKPVRVPKVPLNAVPSPEVPMAILHHQLKAAKTAEETQKIAQKIHDLKEHEQKIGATIKNIVSSVVEDDSALDKMLTHQRKSIKAWQCYKPVTTAFSQKCFTLGQNPFAMTQLYIFVNLCEDGIEGKKIIEAMEKYC